MTTARTILVAATNILWLLSPPILTVFALLDWKRRRASVGTRVTLTLALGTLLLADWAMFVRFMIQSATAYGMYFRPSWAAAALLLISFLATIASLAAPAGRWQLALASVLLLSLWVCIGYAPAHYLHQVDFVAVTVDDHPVPARVYLGHPTDMEAEAFALVRPENGGRDYLLDFDSGKVRRASESEYIRIPGGIWCLRSVQLGTFEEPLPPQQLNQFRVLSRDGHVITVQF